MPRPAAGPDPALRTGNQAAQRYWLRERITGDCPRCGWRGYFGHHVAAVDGYRGSDRISVQAEHLQAVTAPGAGKPEQRVRAVVQQVEQVQLHRGLAGQPGGRPPTVGQGGRAETAPHGAGAGRYHGDRRQVTCW